MERISRRSAISLAVAATAVAAGAAPVLAQGGGPKLPKGVSRKVLGKRESWIPAYKSVTMLDVSFQPGTKHSGQKMPSDMVCHMAEGQLHITKKTEGVNFTAKKGDVWTCRKGDDETAENTGKTVAVMRIIQLIPA